MGNIESIQQEIINEFDFFDDWSEKYQYLIDLGKNLPTFNEINRVDENIVKGCQSNVWLHAEIIDDKKLYFVVNSDEKKYLTETKHITGNVINDNELLNYGKLILPSPLLKRYKTKN